VLQGFGLTPQEIEQLVAQGAVIDNPARERTSAGELNGRLPPREH
jgi:hypothetical protein